MSLAPRLDLRQSQSLVMTPQLQQAIKLLALSNLEIEAFIAEEVEKNPLLEAGATEPSDAPEIERIADEREVVVAVEEGHQAADGDVLHADSHQLLGALPPTLASPASPICVRPPRRRPWGCWG